MALDYIEIANIALTAVQEAGRSVTFRRLSRTVDDPAKPWRGAASPRATVDASVTATAVVVSPGQGVALGLATEDSELVKRSQEIMIVALGATSTDDLTTFDEVLDGTVLWKIQKVDKLKPANTTLLYFVGVSR